MRKFIIFTMLSSMLFLISCSGESVSSTSTSVGSVPPPNVVENSTPPPTTVSPSPEPSPPPTESPADSSVPESDLLADITVSYVTMDRRKDIVISEEDTIEMMMKSFNSRQSSDLLAFPALGAAIHITINVDGVDVEYQLMDHDGSLYCKNVVELHNTDAKWEKLSDDLTYHYFQELLEIE